MFLLTILCGVAVGLSLGLTGGGGSILAVPLLVYGLSIQPQSAVSISLAAVGATSMAGAVLRLLHGSVEMKTGLLFAASGIVGAPLGTWIGAQLSATLLLVLFASVMIVVALRMWMNATRSPAQVIAMSEATTGILPMQSSGPACQREPSGQLPLTSRCAVVLLISGVLTGVLSGLFGVGGGFVIVPALVLITALDIHRAVATSLFVMALISGAGLIAHLAAGRLIPLEIVLPFTAGGVVGLGIGTWGSHRISPVLLQKVFAVVIVAVAAYVITRSFI
jgi:uncharacterized membrane protein YfcA